MDRNKKALFNSFKLKIALMIVFTIITSSAATFGFFYANKSQSGETSMTTSCFNVTYTEGSTFINLTNAIPQTDNSGKKNVPYTFTITNTCDTIAKYHVVLNVKTGSFDGTFIRYMLNNEKIDTLSNRPINTVFEKDETSYDKSYILKVGTLAKDESVTYDLRAWISSVTTYEDIQGQSFEAQVKVVSTVNELEENSHTNITDAIIASAKTGTPDFTTVATTDEGVYAMEDNYGTSYYFRGAVENNYVKFAGYYWRIVRVNGDGSLRIIYDGTTAHANGESSEDRFALANVSWNDTNDDDAKYVGYMYGGANGVASTSKEEAQTNETSSNVKIQLESWYKEKIVDRGYSSNVADLIFCNDRSTLNQSYSMGYAQNTTSFGAYTRFVTNKASSTPTFICSENDTVISAVNSDGEYNNDWFTAEATSENKGNGQLDYPVGLLTADEIIAAGGKLNNESDNIINHDYYLFKGVWFWSFSPRIMANRACIFMVNKYGNLYDNYVNMEGRVVPVINLTPEYVATMRGTGTMTDPYQSWED